MACAMLAGLPCARPLAAQEEAVVQARLDSLTALLPAAERAADIADSIQHPGKWLVAPDTFSVGPITVLARPDQRRLAERAFAEAWQAQEAAFGDSTTLLSDRPFAFHYGSRSAFRGDESHLRIVAIDPIFFPGRRSTEIARLAAERALLNVLAERLPKSIPWMLPTPGREGRLSDVRRELAVVPSRAVQRCYQGDLSWCWEAVGNSDAADRWSRWYSPDQRRLVVLGDKRRLRPERMQLRAQCVTGHAPHACDEFLAGETAPVPLSFPARRTLAQEALRIGGRGAYARLLADTTCTIRECLGRVAGISPDSLMARWRRNVLAAESDNDAGLGSRRWTALLWVLLMAGLAMRSTRWRLG